MKHFALLLSLLSSLTLFSQFNDEQQSQIDSLKLIVKNEKSSPIELINGYNALGELMHVAYLDSVYLMCSLADSIADEELAKPHLDKNLRLQILEGKAAAENSIGVYNYFSGKTTDALQFFEKSLETRREIGDKSGISESINNLAFIYSHQGRYDISLDYNLQSLKLRRALNDTSEVIISLNNIGAIYYKTGNYVDAINYYKQAYDYSVILDDQINRAHIMNNMANVKRVMGDSEGALELYRETAIIYEKLHDMKGLSAVTTNIGFILMVNSDLDSALSTFNKALELTLEENSLANQALTRANLSSIKFRQDLYQDALDQAFLSYDIFTKLNDRKSLGIVHNILGRTYIKINDVENGKKHYALALKYGRESKSTEQSTNTNRELCKLWINQNDLDSAIIYGRSLLALRNSDLDRNFVVLSEREKELFFRSMEEDYMLLYYLAQNKVVKEDLIETAYDNALRIKGLSLKSTTALRKKILNSENESLISDYYSWIKYKKLIANYYTQGKDARPIEKEANRLEKELIEKSSIFKSFEEANQIKWRDVQGRLKNDEAAVEIVVYRNPQENSTNELFYSALILTESGSPKMIKLCSESELEQLLGKIQNNTITFVNEIYGSRKKPLAALYKLVWKPLEKSLNGINQVYISPSGLFHKIAFSALSNEKGELLSNKYRLHIISSTGKIVQNEIESNHEEVFGLFGGANYSTTSDTKEIWSYLPATLKEVDNIELLLEKKSKIKKYVGNEASEENFKSQAPECSILHVATHGYFYPDPDAIAETMETDTENIGEIDFRGGAYGYWSFVDNKNPLMRSGLAFSGANDVWIDEKQESENDGVLTAQEVATLDLRSTELVVLSACETGLGDIKGSEGVYGLQRAFKMAGVRYIIMSLWQVPDKETAEFMNIFYSLYLTSKDIQVSFRQTQLQMQKKYDPYYWAAFVLIE